MTNITSFLIFQKKNNFWTYQNFDTVDACKCELEHASTMSVIKKKKKRKAK